MEKIVARHKNLTVLAIALFVQLLVLGIQVKRPGDGGVSLLRVWTIRIVAPFEKVVVHTSDWAGDVWHSYFYLRGLRAENERLENENMQLRLEQVRTIQDASQARRLQALLKFKEQYVSSTVAAQVIGTSGTETSRILIIDKGSSDGIAPDMAVITPTGVVGKVMRVQPSTAQVLEINDQSSGIGAILEKSRLQGILKGTSNGDAYVHYIMSDEKVEVGENVLTSGGDRIFPKGLPIGTVVAADPGQDMFLKIRVKPAARLDRVEEVLVITRVVEQEPGLEPENPQRAADILAARLPSVPVKSPEAGAPVQPGTENTQAAGGNGQAGAPASTAGQAKPSAPAGTAAAGTGAAVKPKPAQASGTGGVGAGGAQGAVKTGTTKPAANSPKPAGTTPKPETIEAGRSGTGASQPNGARPATAGVAKPGVSSGRKPTGAATEQPSAAPQR